MTIRQQQAQDSLLGDRPIYAHAKRACVSCDASSWIDHPIHQIDRRQIHTSCPNFGRIRTLEPPRERGDGRRQCVMSETWHPLTSAAACCSGLLVAGLALPRGSPSTGPSCAVRKNLIKGL